MDPNYQQILNRLAELEQWKKERMAQQIFFPLDIQSLDVLKKYFLRIISTIEYDAGAGGNHFVHYLAQQDDKIVQIEPPSLVSYTVEPTTDYLTTNQISGNLKFFDDQEVLVYTDGTAPDPLDATTGTSYWVINSDGYTFQLSATMGGAAIDITDKGVGRQFITYA